MRCVTGAIYEKRKRAKLVAHIKIVDVKEEKERIKEDDQRLIDIYSLCT